MKNLRLFCGIATLILAFAFSANAGNIECDGFVSPPTEETTTQGDMNFPVTQAIVIVLETALALP
jgi:hypothetical protein